MPGSIPEDPPCGRGHGNLLRRMQFRVSSIDPGDIAQVMMVSEGRQISAINSDAEVVDDGRIT